jgi:hypothetical protein
MISVRVDFSRGGIECKWWACLCAGALKAGLGSELEARPSDVNGKLVAEEKAY